MALIGKIRKNMWLVIVLVAVALAGFIIQDMTSGKSSGMFSNKTNLGKVAGQKIDIFDFQKTESALYSNSGGDAYAIKNSVWNYYVENALISKIADASGIGVGPEELAELEFGNNLSPIIRSAYSDQSGQVNREQLNEIKKAVDEGTVTNPEFAARFNELRKQVVKQAKQTKLDNMVSKAMYTPTWMAETMDKINGETGSFEYVNIPFSTIPDADVKVTDADYAAYLKKNEVKYTNKEEVRNVAYISYDVKPTLDDSTKILNTINDLVGKFRTSTNDSLFASSNNGFYNNNYAKKDDLIGKLKENIGSVAIGSVFGPFVESGSYVAAKLIDKKVMPDSAKVSHIFRSVQNNDPVQIAAGNKFLDSILVVINGGGSYTELAKTNSQDPSNAAKGGELGTFAPGQLPPSMDNAVFKGKEGGVYKVTTSSGVHLIKVGKFTFKGTDPKYKVAYINQPILASEATQDAQLEKVMAVLEKTKKLDDLSKIATGDLKLEVAGGLKKNDFTLSTLGGGQTSRDIIKWAYEKGTGIGDVSPIAHTYRDEQKFVTSRYVVAALKSIDPKGPASVESSKLAIDALVKAAKKAEMIKSRVSGSDLASIAASFALAPGLAENVSLVNPSIKDAGSEPIVVARTLALNAGSVSKPIEGNAGVFVTKLVSKTPAVVEKGSINQKMMMTQMTRSQVSYKLMEAMKKSADIQDDRSSIY